MPRSRREPGRPAILACLAILGGPGRGWLCLAQNGIDAYSLFSSPNRSGWGWDHSFFTSSTEYDVRVRASPPAWLHGSSQVCPCSHHPRGSSYCRQMKGILHRRLLLVRDPVPHAFDSLALCRTMSILFSLSFLLPRLGSSFPRYQTATKAWGWEYLIACISIRYIVS